MKHWALPLLLSSSPVSVPGDGVPLQLPSSLFQGVPSVMGGTTTTHRRRVCVHMHASLSSPWYKVPQTNNSDSRSFRVCLVGGHSGAVERTGTQPEDLLLLPILILDTLRRFCEESLSLLDTCVTAPLPVWPNSSSANGAPASLPLVEGEPIDSYSTHRKSRSSSKSRRRVTF